MGVLETGIDLAWFLVASEEGPYKLFDLADFEGSDVIGVNSIEDVLAHFLELVVINEDISQVLDGLLVVHLELVSSLVVVILSESVVLVLLVIIIILLAVVIVVVHFKLLFLL